MVEALLLASSFEYDLLAVPQQCDRLTLTGEGTTNASEFLKMTDPSKKNKFIEGEETIFVASLRRNMSSSFESDVQVQADALAIGDWRLAHDLCLRSQQHPNMKRTRGGGGRWFDSFDPAVSYGYTYTVFAPMRECVGLS
jgi:hypothetical protein